jgi:hypothetical protein
VLFQAPSTPRGVLCCMWHFRSPAAAIKRIEILLRIKTFTTFYVLCYAGGRQIRRTEADISSSEFSAHARLCCFVRGKHSSCVRKLVPATGVPVWYSVILLRVEPLLCHDREVGGYTRAVSGQRLGRHVPVARQKIRNNATVERNNGRAVFSMWSVPRCYKQGTRLELSHIYA